MAVARRAVSAAVCNSCQFSVLRSFASLSGCRLDNSKFASRRAAQEATTLPLRRYISTTPILRQNQQDTNPSNPARDEATTNPSAEAEAEDASATTTYQPASSPLPWYLQVSQTPTTPDPTSPIASRQKLPDLPAYPPPILSSLLNHISIDLGLDDLALLDLRDIDPPPALGSNLIMLIGSARSEKHLHVSADRFCRWLRSTYKLAPRADGLLGRNELKLKLRRKAKRARLMSNVGASETASADDGIRTGWICVAIGEVDAAEGAPRKEIGRKDFVGFRDESNKVNVVVQMLTEERREDMDLEGLWNGVIKSAERARKAEIPGNDGGMNAEGAVASH